MINYLILLRIKHWVKNIFIFIPLFFSSQIYNIDKVFLTTITFLGFSFITSFVYVFNDIIDAEFDRMHYEKKNRPIASGKISVLNGLIISFLFLAIGVAILFFYTSFNVLIISMVYLGLNIMYSLKLKNISILDFIVVSSGFVLRVFIGGEVNNIELSNLIVVMVFLLSVFIAVSKRRDDVVQFEKHKRLNRTVVKEYSVEYMDKIITIISSVLLISYLMFIMSDPITDKYDFKSLFFTFCLVLIGVLRYNQIVFVQNKGSSPIKILFKDYFIISVLILWLLTFIYILYFAL
tara:strand:+ start:356 stop:1231 length:876 start_codon:yes stop_codon:yes gene_type:complete